MDIDYVNKDSVKKIILQSGLKRFMIFKSGFNKNSAPVYEYLPVNTTNKNAIDAFDAWANITNNSNPYEIWLFNDYEKSQSENVNRTKKDKLVKFTFVLNGLTPPLSEQNGMGGVNVHLPAQQQPAEKIDMAKTIADAIEQYEKKREQDQTNAQLKAMQDKLDAFINGTLDDDDDDDDDDDEEEKEKETNAKTLLIINKVESILERLDILPAKKAVEKTALAGDEKETKTENKSFNEEALKSINDSILRLAKKDKAIVKHLKMFADLAEQNPETYQSAIEMLEKM